MTISSPDVTVIKTDHFDHTGVESRVTLKFVYPDEHVALVHLTAEKADLLGMQLVMRAAEVDPELVW